MGASAHCVAFAWLLHAPYIGLRVPGETFLSNCMSPLRAKSPSLRDCVRQHITLRSFLVNVARYKYFSICYSELCIHSRIALIALQQQYDENAQYC